MEPTGSQKSCSSCKKHLNGAFDFSGVTLTRKSSMLELSADKYLNKAGLLNADSRIIKVGLRVFTCFIWPIRK